MASPMFPVPKESACEGASDVKWFAGLAMQAMISSRGVPETAAAREEIALWAYRMGQAMADAYTQLQGHGTGSR